MNKQLTKAFLVCIAFLLFFNIVPANWHYVADFEFHFLKSQGCDVVEDKVRCEGYFPLLHILGNAFSFSKLAFARYLMFLLIFITPILLFYITRKWIVTWFYFATTQYVYLIQGGGAYPQALAGVFLLLLLATKNNYLRGLILLISILSHSQAFLLIAVAWFIILFFENFNSKSIFPACSALFGKQEVDPIGQTVSVDLLTTSRSLNTYFFLKDFLNFFVRIFPLPFLIASFWQLYKEKSFALIVLTLVLFYFGVSTTPRIFYMIPLILLPSLTRFYYTLNGKWKYGFLALTGISFIVEMGTWLLFKINCVA